MTASCCITLVGDDMMKVEIELKSKDKALLYKYFKMSMCSRMDEELCGMGDMNA